MDDYSRGWLTATVDAEGCIYVKKIGNRKYPQITVSSTDRIIASRCQQLTGVGTVQKVQNPSGNKPAWIWRVGSIDDAKKVVELIYDGLTTRRRAQARKVLAMEYAELKSHCKNGHEFTPENTHAYNGWRICKECRRQARQRHRQRQRQGVQHA